MNMDYNLAIYHNKNCNSLMAINFKQDFILNIKINIIKLILSSNIIYIFI